MNDLFKVINRPQTYCETCVLKNVYIGFFFFLKCEVEIWKKVNWTSPRWPQLTPQYLAERMTEARWRVGLWRAPEQRWLKDVGLYSAGLIGLFRNARRDSCLQESCWIHSQAADVLISNLVHPGFSQRKSSSARPPVSKPNTTAGLTAIL